MFCGSKILASFTIAVRKDTPPPPRFIVILPETKVEGGRVQFKVSILTYKLH